LPDLYKGFLNHQTQPSAYSNCSVYKNVGKPLNSMWVIPESQNYTACFIIFIFENRKKYNHKNLSVRTDFPFRKFFHVLRNVDVSFGTISTVLIFSL
jgi:hypothetical protein